MMSSIHSPGKIEKIIIKVLLEINTMIESYNSRYENIEKR